MGTAFISKFSDVPLVTIATPADIASMQDDPRQIRAALTVLGLAAVIIVAAFVAHPQPTRAITPPTEPEAATTAPLIVELAGPVYRVKIYAGSENPVCTILDANDGAILAHGLSLPDAQTQFPDLPSLASAIPSDTPDPDGWMTFADVPD